MALRMQAGVWRTGHRLALRWVQTLGTGASPAQHAVLPFEAIPKCPGNPWVSSPLPRKGQDPREQIHLEIHKHFEELGSIFRFDIGGVPQVNVMLPQDVQGLQLVDGRTPYRTSVESWVAYRQQYGHKLGVFLMNGPQWRHIRMKLNQEMFSPRRVQRFMPMADMVARDFTQALKSKVLNEARGCLTLDIRRSIYFYVMEVSYFTMVGKRLGLFGSEPNSASLDFLEAVHTMMRSSLELQFLPYSLSRWTHASVWTQHFKAWDQIFQYVMKAMDSIYQEVAQDFPQQEKGLITQLLQTSDMTLDELKINSIDLLTGNIDTVGQHPAHNQETAHCLLMTFFELSRNPSLQEALRQESLEAEPVIRESPHKVISELPLLSATLKETLRLHPVAMTLQRRVHSDVVLQNYHIPAGTSVSLHLYSLGRNPAVFPSPERYDPQRWMTRGPGENHKHVAFGFGVRQCLGRRLAEMQMLFVLHHTSPSSAVLLCGELVTCDCDPAVEAQAAPYDMLTGGASKMTLQFLRYISVSIRYF
ncbi:cytochrome P450 11B1, mitochondrial-like [Tenrec ecaudatus]|uniref:cytochrome P450 11B1, mitochondrial-like n=1 Tax=Tenrec ecaudatus TaxID=94439 RepID=UPI003F596F1D